MSDLGFLVERPIAHRGLHDGNSGRYENSLTAFDAAIAKRFAIELDVQLSADEAAIVFHDETLDRLTTESGLVADFGCEALQQIRLGPTADHVPSLRDTLDRIAGRAGLVIEMKDNGPRNRALARAVARELDGYRGPVAVMSFSHELLSAWRDTGSAVPLGLTAEGIGSPALARHREALAYGISFVSYHVKALPNPFVSHVRDDLGMPVITWTVRTPDDVALTRAHADQMTFEGFDPDL